MFISKHVTFIGIFLSLLLHVNSEYAGGAAHSSVIHLDEESFPQAIKDPANPLWFLKFYAPWCGHCKKMTAVLEKVAPALEGKLAIGKIDCTVHKGLCNQYKVRGFPTLKYALDGHVDEYPGGRDEKSIVSFATKMSSPSLIPVGSYEDVMEYAESKTADGIVFLGYDSASTKDTPTSLYQIFSQIARKNQAVGHFMWLEPEDPESIKLSAFVKRIEPGIAVRHLENVESLTVETLQEWFSAQNVPVVATIGPSNFQKISQKGRPLAITVADTENEEQFKTVKDHMIDYITKTGDEKYYYGIMDGKKYGKFLSQFKVEQAHIPQFLILDNPTKTFWQNETYGNLFDFMKAVESGDISSEQVTPSAAEGFLAKLEFMFMHFFPYSLIVLFAFVAGFVYLLIPPEDDYDMYNEMVVEDKSKGQEENESKKEK